MQKTNLVNLFGPAETRLETGVVVAREGGAWLVRTGNGVRTLDRAFSCLIEPAASDRVLIASETARGSILAILERPGGGAAVLAHEDGLELRAGAGAVNLTARDGVGVNSATVSIRAGELGLAAARARVATGELEISGRSASATLRDARLEAENVDTSASRWTQRVKRAFRFVEETEILQAGELFQRVRGLFTSRAKTAVMTATDDMKVDGKRIHLG